MYELREGDRDEFFSVPFACLPATRLIPPTFHRFDPTSAEC